MITKLMIEFTTEELIKEILATIKYLNAKY